MPKCWTCGSPVSGWSYTCSSCKGLGELKSLRKKVNSYRGDIGKKIDYLVNIQQEGSNALTSSLSNGFSGLSAGLSEIATAVEWGFGELCWQIQQQTDVLRSIDHTLRTPSETKANEWRLHGEELRRRGVLDESEEFFLKALNEYRLDYRIYVGLAETYLLMEKFDKARYFLEKSLPHAPRQKIDYRSYSYRMIGHIWACEEDYGQAAANLESAIRLSPAYEDGHYDYAQYCAQTGNTGACLSSLEKAILAKPLYWYLAQKEVNFEPSRGEVQMLLLRISTEASYRAKDLITESENVLKAAQDAVPKAGKEADEAISQADQALKISKDKATLTSRTMYEAAKSQYQTAYNDGISGINDAKDKLASGDYISYLNAKPVAEKSLSLAVQARDRAVEGAKAAVAEAYREVERYKQRRADKVKKAWKRVPGALLGWPWLFGAIGSIGGCIVGVFVPGKGTTDTAAAYGGLVGIVIGFIIGIYNIQKELQ
jgi:hypothetical protein